MRVLLRGGLALLCFVVPSGAVLPQQSGEAGQTIPILQVADDLYVLGNSETFSGGNIAVLVGPDGLLLVDAKGESFSEAMTAAVRMLSDKPVRFIINTHCHADHVGGNAAFQRAGTTVVAQTNVYRRLQPAQRIECEQGGVGSPNVTFDSELTLYFADEAIAITALPVGHTDGDAIVYFKNANVVHVGDAFAWPVPFHSKGAGGTALGLADALRKIVALVPVDATVIPGHGPPASMSDIRRTITVLDGVEKAIAQQVQAGKTLDEVRAMNLLEPWKDALGEETDWTLMALYEALSGASRVH